jgi:hypothetical protein
MKQMNRCFALITIVFYPAGNHTQMSVSFHPRGIALLVAPGRHGCLTVSCGPLAKGQEMGAILCQQHYGMPGSRAHVRVVLYTSLGDLKSNLVMPGARRSSSYTKGAVLKSHQHTLSS